MDGKTHMFGGLLITLPVLYISKKTNIPINYGEIVICSIIGSLLPDIDHPKSMLGSKVHPISDMINEFFGHRTLTHSICFVFIVYILTMFVSLNVSIGYSLGILSHIMLDLLTPSGVSIYYPFNTKRIKFIQKK